MAYSEVALPMVSHHDGTYKGRLPSAVREAEAARGGSRASVPTHAGKAFLKRTRLR
jgi:hypothetical protein